MFKYLINIFSTSRSMVKQIFGLKKDTKKVLGRWNTENCDKRTNIKIDMSNEDHCGPCGQYLLTKSNR